MPGLSFFPVPHSNPVCAHPHTRVNICNPNLENLQSALLWLAMLSTQIKLPCKAEWDGVGVGAGIVDGVGAPLAPQ